MKTTTWVCLVTLLMLSVSVFAENREIVGNRKVVTRNIPISNYDEINIAGDMEFVFEQSNKTAGLSITIDENVLPYVKIEVRNNKLYIGTKHVDGDRGPNYQLRPTVYKIKTNSPKLCKLNLAGSADFRISGGFNFSNVEFNLAGSGNVILKKAVKGNELKANVAGSGIIDIKKLSVKSVKGNIAGSGDINFKGKAKDASYNIAGSGNLKATKCKVDDVHASIAGSGNIELYAREKLYASTVGGSGVILYKGNPQVNSSVKRGKNIRKIK